MTSADAQLVRQAEQYKKIDIWKLTILHKVSKKETALQVLTIANLRNMIEVCRTMWTEFI